MNSKATGITYATESPPTRKIWQEFMDAPTPEQRARHPLFTSHVEGLATALHRAADIFRTDPDAYAKILSNLLGSMQSYSWERTAAEYRAIYEQAATGEATSEPSVPHDETRAGASIVNRQ